MPLELDSPRTSAEWLEEPELLFAQNKRHIDPKTGIMLYGPRSLGTARHNQEVHVGFIGTTESAEAARTFYKQCTNGVPGDDDHEPFPGCTPGRGFRCQLHTDLIESIKRREYLDIVGIKNKRQQYEALLNLLQEKMDLMTNHRDHPLDYIVLALSQELYRKCRSVEYVEKGMGKVYRNLRRSFKAMAMSFGKPTQILLETTTGLTTSTRKLDHASVIAWNLFTGLYFKVEGLPWGPTDLMPGTCYVGISFFRPLGESSMLRTSVVQAFDSNGEGLVLRGHKFHWDDEKEGRSPHLPADEAERVIKMVLDQYKLENDRPPVRVVIHKTSRFEPEERAGFEQALKGISRFDLVSLCPASEVRLLRLGQYPPLRGTMFTVGDVSYCYTSGYLRSLGRYPHGHVPSSLQIADHKGDTPRSQLVREVMVLTKMNWNSANLGGLMPITLRFSRLVGDVLREVPESVIPQAKYKFYM